MTALYVLAQEYQAAARALADTDLDDQTITDTLDGMAGDLEDKAIASIMVARDGKRQAARAKAIQARADRIRDFVLATMQASGIQKINSTRLSLAVRQNPPSVVILDADLVPTEFRLPPPEPVAPGPDKKAIKAAIEAGQSLAWATLTRTNRLEEK
jgi:Siphovirus Gp157